LLSIAAVVSLALGFFQDFGPPARENDDPPVDWVEGVAIMVAVSIVVCTILSIDYRPVITILKVVVGSLNDWQKERQFKVLNEKKEERGITVIRDGAEKVIDTKVTRILTAFSTATDTVTGTPGR
jgi:Ca2+-transporting ATPase